MELTEQYFWISFVNKWPARSNLAEHIIPTTAAALNCTDHNNSRYTDTASC